MKYPKKSHYLRFRKKDRYTFYVLDYRGGSLYEMDICCARFLRSLNGCRDPYKNTKGLTEEEAETALEHFEKLGFLDDGIRFRITGPGSFTWTLVTPKENRRIRALARCWNRLLLLLWLPLLAFGLQVLLSGDFPFVDLGWGPIPGAVTGLVPGLSLHEFSHACVCLSYGGVWFEAGIALFTFIPGAYVLISSHGVKGRFRRILRDPRAREKLKKRSLNGKATLAGLRMIRALQIILPLLIIMESARIIGFFTG